MKSLFKAPDSDSSEAYINIETSKHPVAKATKKFIDSLWIKYEKLADTNFEKEIKKDFYSKNLD